MNPESVLDYSKDLKSTVIRGKKTKSERKEICIQRNHFEMSPEGLKIDFIFILNLKIFTR